MAPHRREIYIYIEPEEGERESKGLEWSRVSCCGWQMSAGSLAWKLQYVPLWLKYQPLVGR